MRVLRLFFICSVVTSMLFLFSCNQKGDRVLVIGAKNFTENIILGEIINQTIAAQTDIETEMQGNLGATFIVFEAIKKGDIDIYADYTGTLYQANLKQTDRRSADETYAYVKREIKKLHNLEVLAPFGFNNTYALGMKKEFAERYNLKKISDLVNFPEIRYVFDNEFASRKDGADEMFKFYNIAPNEDYLIVDVGLRYQAIIEDKADITDAFSTDAKLKRFNIFTLEDDKQFFPPYYAVPVVRADVLEEYPQVGDALALLDGILTEDEITALSFAVEEEKQKESDVVDAFLRSKGIKQ